MQTGGGGTHLDAAPRLTGLGPRRRRIVGDVDAFTARAIEPAILRLVERRPVVLLDLSGVRVLTSGGLAMLERAYAHADAQGCRLLLLVADGSLIHRVLQLSSLPEATIADRRRRRPAR